MFQINHWNCHIMSIFKVIGTAHRIKVVRALVLVKNKVEKQYYSANTNERLMMICDIRST